MQKATTTAETTTKKAIKIPAEVTSKKVRDYLKSKGRGGRGTPATYGEGMVNFQRFLAQEMPQYNEETVLDAAKAGVIDIYQVVDRFVSYLQDKGYAPGSIHPWVEGVKGYCNRYDIDIVPYKFKQKVTMPRIRREDEYAPTKEEVRSILLAIRNQRLNTYCNFLRMGSRAVEGLAVRACDINFSVSPIRIYMRAEYSKNGLPREMYAIDEVEVLMKRWWIRKYGALDRMPDNPNDLFFGVMDRSTPEGLYTNIAAQFRDTLKAIGMNRRRERGRQKRHDITLHTFRRWAETIIEDHTSENFANYILGHKKSPYYNHPEPERRKIFAERCAAHMQLFNYRQLEIELVKKDHVIGQFDLLRSEFQNVLKVSAQQQQKIDELEKKLEAKEAKGQ